MRELKIYDSNEETSSFMIIKFKGLIKRNSTEIILLVLHVKFDNEEDKDTYLKRAGDFIIKEKYRNWYFLNYPQIDTDDELDLSEDTPISYVVDIYNNNKFIISE